MAEQAQTSSSSVTAPSASSTMKPTSYSSENTRRVEGLVVGPSIMTASERDVTSRHTELHTSSTPLLFAEPPHPVEDNASSSHDTQFGPKDTHLSLMPRCFSSNLLTSIGLQESDDIYGRSMPSASAAVATSAALGCAASSAIHASFTPGASTSMPPAPTEAQSANDSRPLPHHRWGGHNGSGSQCASYRGADRSNNASGCGLRLVGDDAEWLQSSFEGSASSPREEVQLSWRHLQDQQHARKSSAHWAMPPALKYDGAGAVLTKMSGAHHRFERAVQPQSQLQSACMSVDEEDSQAAAMLWAAQQMAAFD
ncbi:hypothetical protein CUR178_08281 [Leishmania enriettii]|uniref:Uncharacterized protein n=1 Tax=Leishmania enriettii TaxID=5663 RepID=A0A836H0J8_LEIEN|nr:hypothetical protein CUR178_08281 [Leishmania enriettii]